MAMMWNEWIGIPPKMLLLAAQTLMYNADFQVMILTFGLMVSGLFGLLEIMKHIRRR